jgi:hypothetical protein
MSDTDRLRELLLAVDAAPPTPDPVGRVRRRMKRRRRAVAGAAGLALAVGGAGAAVAGDLGGDRREVVVADQAAEPRPAEERTYVLSFAQWSKYGASEDAVDRCLTLPGVQAREVDMPQFPAAYSVTVSGSDEIAAFENCARALPAAALREEQPINSYMPPAAEVRVPQPVRAGEATRLEVAINDDQDVAVHRVEFGDGAQQVVQILCEPGTGAAPGPGREQTHRVTHTWQQPGSYTVSVHYGPPCGEPTSSVATTVRVSP